MTTILLRKTHFGYDAVDDAATQVGHKIKVGSVVTADISMRDNGTDQQRRYAFALIGLLFECQESFDDAEDFRYYMTCRVGYAMIKKSPDGPIPIPKSWSRGGMDKAEWIGLIGRLLDFGENVFGIARDDLESRTAERVK
jgi:hypothetical protein